MGREEGHVKYVVRLVRSQPRHVVRIAVVVEVNGHASIPAAGDDATPMTDNGRDLTEK